MDKVKTVQKLKPLSILMVTYLKLHRHISLRAILLGADPTTTPKWLQESNSRWLNRSTLVDLYAMLWPLCDCFLLWLVMARLSCHATVAPAIALVALYRLNELFGGIFWVLTYRANVDSPNPRKFAFTFLNYVEPILLFAVLHGAISDILSNGGSQLVPGGYLLEHRCWNWVTVLHYSVGRYTTVGAEGVSPTSPLTTILSDIETLVGVIMIVLTISVFVSRTISPPDSTFEKSGASPQPEQPNS